MRRKREMRPAGRRASRPSPAPRPVLGGAFDLVASGRFDPSAGAARRPSLAHPGVHPHPVIPRRTSRAPSRSGAARVVPHLAALAILTAGITLRLFYLPFNVHTPDEDTYVDFYGRPLEQHGLGALPKLLEDYNARAPMQQFPPPTRVGYLLPMVGAMKLSHDADLTAAASLSVWASAGLLLALYGFARLLDPWSAAIATLFAAFSPLDLAMSRRAWPDEPLGLCATAVALLLARFRERPTSALAAISALALSAWAATIKETGLFVLGFATLVLAFTAWRASGPAAAARWLAGGIVAFLAAAGITAWLCGGIAPVWTALVAMQRAAEHNPYVLQYQTGDLRYYIRGLALLQPMPVALGLAGAVLALKPAEFLWSRLHGRAPQAALLTLGWMTLALGIALALLPQKNLRFLSPVYPACDLLAGALIVAAWRHLAVRISRAWRFAGATALAAGLVGAAWLDYTRFLAWFVSRGIPDLATPWFKR